MSENELAQKDEERKEFLENVMSAYFLEKNLSDLKSDLNSCKEARPSAPKKPTKPEEPTEEPPCAITPVPYPEVKTPDIPSQKLWKKGLLIAVAGLIVSIITSNYTIGILGGCVFYGGLIYTIVLKFKDKKQQDLAKQEYIEKYKQSPEYRNQCVEIDKENQRLQGEEKKKVHEKYLKDYENYQQECRFYEQELQEYNTSYKHYLEETIPQWENEQNEISTAINSVRNALNEVYGKNIIPAQYRGIGTVGWLAAFLGTSKFDLKTAIERYDSYVANMINKEQLDVAKMQTSLLNDIRSNTNYSTYLQEQMIDITEHGNKTLQSISNWQKTDFLLDEYRLHKRRKARRKS